MTASRHPTSDASGRVHTATAHPSPTSSPPTRAPRDRRRTLATLTCAGLLFLIGGAACVDVDPQRPAPQNKALTFVQPAMGTRFAISIDSPPLTAIPMHARAVAEAFAIIHRLDASLSHTRPDNTLAQINANAHRAPIPLDPDTYAIIALALEVSAISAGAFDITIAACSQDWSFAEQRMPPPAARQACLSRVDYRQLRLDPQRHTLFFAHPELRISLGAIAKGYAVDRAAERLQHRGIERFLVDGSGDLRAASSNRPWRIGIRHPRQPGLLASLTSTDIALATSGDYQQSFFIQGQRMHHILDPRNALPAHAVSSVSVIAPNAALADALATALFVLGPNAAIDRVAALPQIEALIVASDGSIWKSKGFPDH